MTHFTNKAEITSAQISASLFDNFSFDTPAETGDSDYATPKVLSEHREIRYETMAETYERPDPEYLVEDLIPENAIGVFYGPSGIGKSFVTLSMCLHLAYSLEWRGLRQAPKGILYIVAEGSSGTKLREEAWRVKNKITSFSDHFLKIPHEIDILENMDVQAIIDGAKDRLAQTGIKTDLVVFDTLSQ